MLALKNRGSTIALAVAVAGAALCVAGASSARASTINLGGGWSATWDDSLNPYLSLAVDGIGPDAVFIEKSAQFTQPPANGVFPSINILFQQTAADAKPYIVITDEVVLNSTGAAWDGFSFILLDTNEVNFDPARTAVSGGGPPIGFSISPFTTASYVNNNSRLNIGGGTLANGAAWFPGGGANDGQLWINALPKLTQPFRAFTLKELPTPEPASLSLLALGALGMRRRRMA